MVTDSAQAHRFWMGSLLHIPSVSAPPAQHADMHNPREPSVRRPSLPSHFGFYAVLPYLSLLLYIC